CRRDIRRSDYRRQLVGKSAAARPLTHERAGANARGLDAASSRQSPIQVLPRRPSNHVCDPLDLVGCVLQEAYRGVEAALGDVVLDADAGEFVKIALQTAD